MSFKKWGLKDFSWVFAPCNTLPRNASSIVYQMCVAWNLSKKHLTHRAPTYEVDILSLLLQSRNVCHLPRIFVGCLSNQQKKLYSVGLHLLANISKLDGSFVAWEDSAVDRLLRSAQQSYSKLITTLTCASICTESSSKTYSFFVTPRNLHNCALIWEFYGA